jgi:hypothetical protein
MSDAKCIYDRLLQLPDTQHLSRAETLLEHLKKKKSNRMGMGEAALAEGVRILFENVSFEGEGAEVEPEEEKNKEGTVDEGSGKGEGGPGATRVTDKGDASASCPQPSSHRPATTGSKRNRLEEQDPVNKRGAHAPPTPPPPPPPPPQPPSPPSLQRSRPCSPLVGIPPMSSDVDPTIPRSRCEDQNSPHALALREFVGGELSKV